MSPARIAHTPTTTTNEMRYPMKIGDKFSYGGEEWTVASWAMCGPCYDKATKDEPVAPTEVQP